MSVKSYTGLLRRWDGLCVICGGEFTNKDSVTKEHIVPRSRGGKNNSDNIAPSHFRCNQIREDLSLMEAVVLIETKRKQMSEEEFDQWVNASVPHRYPLLERGNKDTRQTTTG